MILIQGLYVEMDLLFQVIRDVMGVGTISCCKIYNGLGARYLDLCEMNLWLDVSSGWLWFVSDEDEQNICYHIMVVMCVNTLRTAGALFSSLGGFFPGLYIRP